ncbi:hypothetical protein [Paenibacillus pinihumi]|uniref:hypothetical protein n=1 Tax=Paenibacillus pinihumi TaxID=669462 RepID=UPI00048BD963|nr:hypothetical protein [Paenibacillus pinihumi]
MQKITKSTEKSDKWRSIIESTTIIREDSYEDSETLRNNPQVGSTLMSALHRRGSLKGVRLG